MFVLIDPKSLPVSGHEAEITNAVLSNQVIIITAETGSGKTTLVPPMFMRAGFKVACTQPRRLAARSVASHVAKQEEQELGVIIGYRTGFERMCSADTRLLYTTDGTELVREIVSDWQPEILIVDEVHEWGVETEALVAWAKKRLKEGANFRLIIMSATLEAERLSKYFDNAPVIDVEGRLFPVEEREMRGCSLESEVMLSVIDGHNILVFQPGKKEIDDCIMELRRLQVEAEILPLHGDLTPEEQDRVFQSYNRPKVIVATNVAETSVTVPDIDMVLDTQMEKRVETRDGVEGLYLHRISLAQVKQRRGRAGRCKEGIYVNCYRGYESQEEFPKAEIERVRLDQLILRLACHGINVMDLEFFHQPDTRAMAESYRTLRILGALTADNKPTVLGKEISRWPVSIGYAKMLVLARNIGQLPAMIRIVACLEVGGIQSRVKDAWRNLPYSGQSSSDAIAQYYYYEAALKLPEDSRVFEENGMSLKHFRRALEIRRKLERVAGGRQETAPSTINADLLSELVISGMLDKLHVAVYGRRGTNVSDGRPSYSLPDRQLSNRSVVSYALVGRLLVGEPVDIETEGKFGLPFTLKLLSMVTTVDSKIVLRHAPHCAKIRRSDWRWSVSAQKLMCSLSLTLDDATFELSQSEPERLTFDEVKALVASGELAEIDLTEICRQVARTITMPAETEGLPPEIRSKVKLRCDSVQVTMAGSRYGTAKPAGSQEFGTSLAGLFERRI